MCSLRSVLIVIVGLPASAPWLAMLVWPCPAPGQTTAAPLSSRPASKQPADGAQIERLIRQLGSTQFAEREAASKALDALGETALPALRKVQQVPDPEVRRRVGALLQSLTRKRAPMRAKAWDAIQKAGGVVVSKDGTPNSLITVVGFDGPKRAGDTAAVWLPYFDDAQHLSLTDTRISDNGLVYVETFYQVEGLTLTGTRTITDAGLKHVGKLVTLETLGLSSTRVTDAGLPHLKKLENLILLDLSNTRITDAGLEHLKKLKALESLDLSRTQITDAGLDHIKELKGLETLTLSHTHITDVGLAKLKSLKKMTWLDLTETQVTDKGLACLKEIQTLQGLRVDRTKVTERGKAEWLKKEAEWLKKLENNAKPSGANRNHGAK